VCFAAFFGCQQPGSATTYLVQYNPNGAAQAAPVDSNRYTQGETVTVGNKGILSIPSYGFAGWMTKTDGTGTSYVVGNTFTMGSADVTLFAVWIDTTIFQFASNGTDIKIIGFNTTPGGVTVPIGVTRIDNSAMFNASSMTTLTLPPSVSSIGTSAINGCSSLTSVTVQATTPPALAASPPAFTGCAALASILVPSASVAAYKAATGWSDYSAKIVGY
jgi:hypothetical protein